MSLHVSCVFQSSQGLGLAIQSGSTVGKEGIYIKTVSQSGPAGEVKGSLSL